MAVATTPVTSTSLAEVNAQGIDTRIIAERTERHFCKCAVCKQSTTIDFEVVVWEFAHEHYLYPGQVAWEPRTTYYRINSDGTKAEVKNAYIAACPRCGALKPRNTMLNARKVKYDAHHACTDSCQKATSDNCSCSCSGKNHGKKNKVNNSLF